MPPKKKAPKTAADAVKISQTGATNIPYNATTFVFEGDTYKLHPEYGQTLGSRVRGKFDMHVVFTARRGSKAILLRVLADPITHEKGKPKAFTYTLEDGLYIADTDKAPYAAFKFDSAIGALPRKGLLIIKTFKHTFATLADA